LPVVNIIPSPT